MKSLIVPVLLCSFRITSCGGKESMVQPPVTLGTAKSLKAYAGNGRIKLSWQLPTDEGISKCRIYWNNKMDSLTVPVSTGNVSGSAVIGHLKEGSYTFFVSLMDNKGNISDKVPVNGNVYGEKYAALLKNRIIQKDIRCGEL